MMITVFADTFYYLALANLRDAAHARAVAAGAQGPFRLVTSAWVIQELADGCASPPSRAGFLRLWSALEADSYTEIVAPTGELWNRGKQLYRSRADKSWSLTDCISFEIMRDRGITDALTADHHFQQAGFKAMLI
ncbi:MAG: PIN domain-containing protein [Tepidisphaeraceae bacterium]|jgi:predicted nucleic acid-binding protein